MSPDIGYAVVGGVRFDIDRLWLGRSHDGTGSVLIEFTLTGPLPAIEGPITVFAPDGTGCWQGHIMSFPPILDGYTWVMQYAMTVGAVDGPDRVATFWGPGTGKGGGET